MMRTITTRFLLLLLALSLCGCETVDRTLDAIGRPSAQLAGMSLDDIDLEGATVLLDVEVQNPYSVPLPLLDLDYAFASRGAPFLSGKADLDGVVPARSSRNVALPARVGFRDLMSALSGVRPGKLVPYRAELGLGVDAPALGALRLPLAKEGQLPVPAPPEVKVQEIRWDEVSLDRIQGLVSLDLLNRNEFPVDLSQLDYGLQLAGVEVARSSLARGVSFPAQGRGSLDIPVSFSPKQLGLALLSSLTGNETGYQFSGATLLDTRFGEMRLPVLGAGTAPLRSR